jgi:calcineurin-like phosphoesterase family protein
MIYLISDTHFYHKNIIKYDNRDENYIDIIKNELLILKSNDTLIHLGDIFFSKGKESMQIFKDINCYKILIKGNHDYKKNEWYIENGFNDVYEELLLNINNKKILLTHIPQNIYNTDIDFNIHGHLHSNLHHIIEYLSNKHKLVIHKLKTIYEIIGE